MTEEQEVTVEELKERCIALIDEVSESRRSLVVTMDGAPVARLEPIARDLAGSIVFHISDEELVDFNAWDGYEKAQA